MKFQYFGCKIRIIFEKIYVLALFSSCVCVLCLRTRVKRRINMPKKRNKKESGEMPNSWLSAFGLADSYPCYGATR